MAIAMAGAAPARLPNIVIMLADDLGFGELSCLNPDKGKIQTPQLDRIASRGMTFMDAHSGSSVCTPTRYGLLTGRYAWRTRLQQGVLTVGESLISEDRMTLSKLLDSQGYHTAIIGKWHLGMLFDGKQQSDKVTIGSKVSHGPLDRGGFDEFHGFHHARQMGLWIEDDQVTATLKPMEMLPKLTAAAVDYIRQRKQDSKPFFLYVPWNAPHSPVVPTEAWKGKSGLNEHADFVMQTDDSFGQVYRALEETGLIENTLVICTSDNGTSPTTSQIKQLIKKGHHPSGPLRGSKADLWDGGHRVPFIASWPGEIEADSRTNALICLTDIFATVAEIVDVSFSPSEGVDSESFLPVLLGKKDSSRATVVHHSISGKFSIRDQSWKLLLAPGSGGWSEPRDPKAVDAGWPATQLYSLDQDLGETTNLRKQQPERVKKMRAMLEEQVVRGRSTPGPDQVNDVKIDIDKPEELKKKSRNSKR